MLRPRGFLIRSAPEVLDHSLEPDHLICSSITVDLRLLNLLEMRKNWVGGGRRWRPRPEIAATGTASLSRAIVYCDVEVPGPGSRLGAGVH